MTDESLNTEQPQPSPIATPTLGTQNNDHKTYPGPTLLLLLGTAQTFPMVVMTGVKKRTVNGKNIYHHNRSFDCQSQV